MTTALFALEVMYLMAIAAIDQWRKTIPVLFLLLGALLALAGSAQIPGDFGRGLDGALVGGFTLGTGYMGSRILLKGKEGIGLGDVLLGAVLGMMVGPSGIIMAMGIAFLAALGMGFCYPRALTGRTAFGPYYAFGGIVVLLWGKPLFAFINQHWFA